MICTMDDVRETFYGKSPAAVITNKKGRSFGREKAWVISYFKFKPRFKELMCIWLEKKCYVKESWSPEDSIQTD